MACREDELCRQVVVLEVVVTIDSAVRSTFAEAVCQSIWFICQAMRPFLMPLMLGGS